MCVHLGSTLQSTQGKREGGREGSREGGRERGRTGRLQKLKKQKVWGQLLEILTATTLALSLSLSLARSLFLSLSLSLSLLVHYMPAFLARSRDSLTCCLPSCPPSFSLHWFLFDVNGRTHVLPSIPASRAHACTRVHKHARMHACGDYSANIRTAVVDLQQPLDTLCMLF